MKIISVVGTRPNFMKIAPIIRVLKEHSFAQHLLVHTGQHYDDKMSDSFFRDLEIPHPDINLQIGSDSQTRQVARIMTAFESVCEKHAPDVIIVVGDVNSTMACSLVAAKMGIKIVHVEAGIRSRDRSMPEEINRMVTDSITDYLLPPSRDAVENLIHEGHLEDHICMVGNVMVDTLKYFQPQIHQSTILEKLNLEKQKYAALTLHRPSNVDRKSNFLKILDALEAISQQIPIVFPIHPRTRKMIHTYELDEKVKAMPRLMLTDPMGYFDFGKLIADSKFVLTDSGGIQEETTVYGIPCITLRENTERPVTITKGTNEIAGTDTQKIIGFAEDILAGIWKSGSIPEMWDGKTAERIVDFLIKIDDNGRK